MLSLEKFPDIQMQKCQAANWKHLLSPVLPIVQISKLVTSSVTVYSPQHYDCMFPTASYSETLHAEWWEGYLQLWLTVVNSIFHVAHQICRQAWQFKGTRCANLSLHHTMLWIIANFLQEVQLDIGDCLSALMTIHKFCYCLSRTEIC